MSTIADLRGLVMKAAQPVLEGGASGADIEEITDSSGADALKIRVLLKDANLSQNITGEKLLSILTSVHAELMKAGNRRFPLIEYWTDAEMNEEAESEELESGANEQEDDDDDSEF